MKQDGFFQRVYGLVEQIPPGKVATYGQIAMLLGSPRHARAVGYAMGSAPAGRGVPCHRVVNRLGALAPVDIFGGMQRQMLEEEGVLFLENGRIDLKRCLWRPR